MDSSNEMYVPLLELMPLIKEYLAEGKTTKFLPQGISMLPMLRQGIDSVVLCPITGRLKKYDLPLYQRDDGKYILHRVVRAGDTYTCIGDNQFVLEHGLRHDQMIAIVSGFYRDKKYYSVSDWRYQLYCRFWHYSRPVRHFWSRGVNYIRRHLK